MTLESLLLGIVGFCLIVGAIGITIAVASWVIITLSDMIHKGQYLLAIGTGGAVLFIVGFILLTSFRDIL